ncbi:hypothetical protein EC973_003258 [Apophysomyces ossiformis]|uniref:Carbohydrate kinase PfkB domain-containing protein n=1 Tax=Apophysomyces ossiformis TaxID=679940 RepID=A0A8H7BY53_9FUNG|nr:hypothetical protein EC973_003258 [Apophysomyces ossiformis]
MGLPFAKKTRSKASLSEASSSSSSRAPSRSNSWDCLPSLTVTDNSSYKPVNVLLVGQIYLDTILHMDRFPEEDSKRRAESMEQRRGGNSANAAEVLSQFPRVNVWLMSAVGPKESTSSLLSQLESKAINTSVCINRKTPTPSSYIIHSKETGSRTIISCTNTEEITRDEFARKFEMATIQKTMDFDTVVPFSWVHFEGRNIDQTLQQIEWLEAKAIREGWRPHLTISVELEKPDRENIDLLMPKGDVVFFSKLFAEKRGYVHPKDFLKAMIPKCKPQSILFCTWGAQGATCVQAVPRGEFMHASALPIHQVVDSVGAGDTFIAGIIFCLSRGLGLLSSLKFSCELASRKVAQSGFDGLAKVVYRLWEASLVTAAHGRQKSDGKWLSIDVKRTTSTESSKSKSEEDSRSSLTDDNRSTATRRSTVSNYSYSSSIPFFTELQQI